MVDNKGLERGAPPRWMAKGHRAYGERGAGRGTQRWVVEVGLRCMKAMYVVEREFVLGWCVGIESVGMV